jgi:hypothetical protein
MEHSQQAPTMHQRLRAIVADMDSCVRWVSFCLLVAHKAADRSIVETRASSADLYAASRVLPHHCEGLHTLFIACKARDQNPMACYEEGKRVHQCARDVFRLDTIPFVLEGAFTRVCCSHRAILASPCQAQFGAYSQALEKKNLEFEWTRKEERAFHECWLSHINQPDANNKH